MKNITDYKHIIWDWNGTLFNDVDLCVKIMSGILSRRSLPVFGKEHYKNIFTFPVIKYYELAGLDLEKFSFEDLSIEFITEYEANKYSGSLYTEVADVLAFISGKGISQSILSAYSQNTLEEVINHFGIPDYFNSLNGLNNIYAESKIEIGRKLMRRLNCGTGEVLLVGDSVHDFEVANEIGADAVLVSHGHQSHEILIKYDVPVITSLKELPGYQK